MPPARRDPAIFAGLGPRLFALRQAHGWSQGQLGRQSQVNQSMVWAYEHGTKRPRPETLRRLADVLGADYDELARLAGN